MNLLSSSVISKIMYSKCKNLFNSLDSYSYAVIKGEPLSVLAYNQPGMRTSGDIDFLVPRNEIANMEKCLVNNGFTISNNTRSDRITLLTSSHQTVPFNSEGIINVQIDINFDIFWGEYTGKRIDISAFLTDVIEMDIYGCRIKTLPPLKAMIQLILHHYKDMNSLFLLATRKSIRYEMFKDVYYLLKNNLNVISLNKLYDICAEYEIIPYAFYVLFYTGQVFDDKVLKQYIEAFRTCQGEALLNCYGLCSKEQKEWKCDFKTRLESNNLYNLIKDDLTERDKKKIAINRRVFSGTTE